MLNPEFTEMLRLTDATVFDGLPEALTATAPETSVRLNHGKAPGADIASLCGAPDIADGTVPWSSGSGFYLCRRPNFTLLPALHQGLLYVQDASSMCLSHIIAALAAQLGGGRPAPARRLRSSRRQNPLRRRRPPRRLARGSQRI